MLSNLNNSYKNAWIFIISAITLMFSDIAVIHDEFAL